MQWNLITGETHENVQLVLFLSLYILRFFPNQPGGGGGLSSDQNLEGL